MSDQTIGQQSLYTYIATFSNAGLLPFITHKHTCFHPVPCAPCKNNAGEVGFISVFE